MTAVFSHGMCVGLDALDDDGGGHAARRTHGDKAALEVPPFQFVEDRADQHRAGGADGMAQRNGAAVDVHLLRIEAEVAIEFRNHDCESLVDLPKIDIAWC